MTALLTPIIIIVVLATVSPMPAMACFHIAWSSDRKLKSVSPAVVVPPTVFPVILLILHGLESVPEWKQYGIRYQSYLALGWSAWAFLLPFAASNFLIARSLLAPSYCKSTPLIHICLFTCLLTCVFLAVGNRDRGISWVFHGSAACAYGYGLHLLLELQQFPKLLLRSWLLIVAWFITAVLTVLAAIFETRKMVAQLPDESPGCFVVTAATCGHSHLVHSHIDSKTGKTTSKQLTTFRAFEKWLQACAPQLHRTARLHYNKVGPVIAERIASSARRADIAYLALKPLEWLLRLTRFL